MAYALTRRRHETRLRRLTVERVEALTPRMRRMHFRSPDLAGFESPGFDDHVKLFFPHPGEVLEMPPLGPDGAVWPGERPVMRDYTPRMWSGDRIAIDFVLHDHGPASDWARSAAPGDGLLMGGPRGSFVIDGRPDWEILMGDATALPAICRRLEDLPPDTRVQVIVQIADSAERIALTCRAQVEVTWLAIDRGGTLVGWLPRLGLPPGEGFVFCGAEAATVDQVRARLAALGHPSDRGRVSNYWRAGAAS
jgi:NADPH-dependent ferric siderophore reductase